MCSIMPGGALNRALGGGGEAVDRSIYGAHLAPALLFAGANQDLLSFGAAPNISPNNLGFAYDEQDFGAAEAAEVADVPSEPQGAPIEAAGKEKRKPSAQLKLCEHNMRKSLCKSCTRCPHDRLKRTCKDCGGPAICIHKKRKSTCRECGGNMHECRDTNITARM